MRLSQFGPMYMQRFGFLQGCSLIVKRLGFKGPVCQVNLGGLGNPFYLRTFTSDWATFDQIFLFEEYEHETLERINPKFIVDAGANVGHASIYFASKFPGAKVVAIEPEASNFAALTQNTEAYASIDRIQAGLWPTDHTKLAIRDPHVEKWEFRVDEQQTNPERETDAGIDTITVSRILDMYQIDQIDILKIDIECAEKQVFAANYESWLDKVKVLIIETHDFMEPGCAKSVFSALANYEFNHYIKGGNQIFVLGGAS